MPKKKQVDTNNPVELEKAAIEEAEAAVSRADEPSLDAEVNNQDEEAEKGLIAEEAADADSVMPAEVAAISTDNETAMSANEEPLDGVTPVKGAKAKKDTKAKADESAKTSKSSSRSRAYEAARSIVEAGKSYLIDEAIEVVKKASYTKFDGSIELHLKLNKKKSKGGTESSKGTFHLPHGSGKTKNIIILDEAKIEEIFKTKKIDFDIAIATPALMPKVGKIAKILGPKGKMPDPKSGTVTTEPEKTIEEINSGKVEYRIDSSNNIHQIIGKTSWETGKIKENANAILATFPKSRIAAAFLTATMAPSVQLDISALK